MITRLLSVALAAEVAPALLAAGDLILADFEADSYGAWTASGEAFGPGPA